AVGWWRYLGDVGAEWGEDEIEELAQDAVLIEALHLGERPFDSLSDRFRCRPAFAEAEPARWVEEQMEQLDEIACQTGVPGHGIGKVAQAKGLLELAQIGAVGAHDGDLAPLRPRRYDQAIEAVIVGFAAKAREKASLEPGGVVLEFDRTAIDPLQHHVVQGDVDDAVGKARS